MIYAVFDIDKTLIKKDSLILSAIFFNRNKIEIIKMIFLIIPYYFFFKFGIINTGKFKEKFIEIFRICDFFNNSENYKEKCRYREILIENIRPEALQRINFHKSEGHKIILCSASPRMIITPLADYLEVDLLCTELEKSDKKWLPKVKGSNCNGLEKTRRLEAFIGPLDKHYFHAYGDSIGDRELLNKSTWPHYRSFSDKSIEYPEFSISKILPIMILSIILYASYILKNYGITFFSILNELSYEICTGLLIILFGYFLRYIRWRIFLRALNLNPPFKIDLISWMGSYAFTVTPGKAGEAIRAILLKRRCNLPISKTLISIFMERLSDVVSVLTILIINFSL